MDYSLLVGMRKGSVPQMDGRRCAADGGLNGFRVTATGSEAYVFYLFALGAACVTWQRHHRHPAAMDDDQEVGKGLQSALAAQRRRADMALCLMCSHQQEGISAMEPVGYRDRFITQLAKMFAPA